MENNTTTVNTLVLQNDMKYDGVTILSYKIEYPQFKSSLYQMSLAVINRFYKNKALAYQNRCETELYNMAVEQYKFDKENGYPVRPFEALLTFKMTFSRACIISLYFDQYEYTGGAHGNTIRSSQTWNLQKTVQLKLSELFECPNYREYIFNEVIAQIKKNPDIYFEDYEQLVRSTFNEESFYSTPYGIVVYYQQYDIAPYASGIREFLIPYSDCVINPVRKCFSLR